MKMSIFNRPNPDNKYNLFIRERIREAREELHMTQEELAQKIYKSRVQISDLERGRTQVSASELVVISLALHKPIMYFYPFKTPTEKELREEEQELIHHFRGIRNGAMEKYAIKTVRELADASHEAHIQEIAREQDEEMLTDDEETKPKKKKK